jgi:hypothetical protein
MTCKPAEPGMAAVVCIHVMHEELPIRSATRVVGDDQQASGWMFSCGVEPHPDSEWKVVEVDWCFDTDPSLNKLLDMPVDHWAHRQGPDRDWTVEPL